MEERVVEAEAAGPDQHGALEQRCGDGGRRGGGVEGERGGGSAPRRDRARERGEERGLRRWEAAEGEGAWRRGDGGGWAVEEIGKHGELRYGLAAECACPVCAVCSVLRFSASPTRHVELSMVVCSENRKIDNNKSKKNIFILLVLFMDFCGTNFTGSFGQKTQTSILEG